MSRGFLFPSCHIHAVNKHNARVTIPKISIFFVGCMSTIPNHGSCSWQPGFIYNMIPHEISHETSRLNPIQSSLFMVTLW